MSSTQHFDAICELTKTVQKDRRDEWPTTMKSYSKGENLSVGYFGIVRFADCRDPVFGFSGLEVRRCVIKTIYLQRRLDSIVSNNNKPDNEEEEENDVQSKMFRFYRSIVMELYILSRCRHEHIMHAHSVFVTDDDLHIVLPRFYVLSHLISLYRIRKESEPIPVQVIAKILRQLCIALDYLQRVGIAHRDVQPENIYITRQGTVKLGHFGQSIGLVSDDDRKKCRTPVGKEEFMSFEKLHNLKKDNDWISYSHPSDIWSLGVLILNMVAYFPEEKNQKLRKDFAFVMHGEKMPFIWLTVEMLQLRSRLVKSGGEQLKSFLSEKLLTVHPEKRATAASLLKTREMQEWCLETVDQDKVFLRKKFIDEVDFVNRLKLVDNAPNYECLEAKDIPAEFYWSDTWKNLEESEFLLKFDYDSEVSSNEYRFKFSDSEPLFKILHSEYADGRLKFIDIIPLDFEVKETIYELVGQENAGCKKDIINAGSLRKRVCFPDVLNGTETNINIDIRYAPKRQHRLFSSGSSSSDS